jgi:hypothetical protein
MTQGWEGGRRSIIDPQAAEVVATRTGRGVRRAVEDRGNC